MDHEKKPLVQPTFFISDDPNTKVFPPGTAIKRFGLPETTIIMESIESIINIRVTQLINNLV